MEKQNRKLKLEWISRNQIRVELAIIPKKLELKSIGPDKDIEQQYKLLLEQTKFEMPIIAGRFGKDVFLIDNYELFRTFSDIHYKNPEAVIPCLTLVCDSLSEIKLLSVRLSKLRCEKDSSHLHRLLNLHLLNILNLTPREIRGLMGIGNDSAGRKMLERDRRLLNNPKILSLVLGVQENELKQKKFESIAIPQPHKAKLTYNQGIRLLEILPDCEAKIEQFIGQMNKLNERIETSNTSPDEKTLPVFQRRNFSFGDLLAIAKSIATDGKYSALNDGDEVDQRWSVTYSDLTGDLSLDKLNLNLHANKDPANIKLIVDAKYKARLIYETLAAHLSRIRPTNHGGLTKVREAETVLKFDFPSNKPRLEDRKYNDEIRRDCTILSCNRDHFLKCIGLKAQVFDFPSSAYNSTSTMQRARKAFESFYTRHLEEVANYYASEKARHPFEDYYCRIKTYLEKHASASAESGDSSEPVLFCDFFVRLFSEVHVDMDKEEEIKIKRLESYEKKERQLDRISENELHRLYVRFAKEGSAHVTKSELESLIQSRVAERETRILTALNVQNKTLERLLADPLEKNRAAREGSPLKVRDLQNFKLKKKNQMEGL